MLMGWASGRFGLFGLTKQAVAHETLNSIGVAVAVVGLMLFIGVKPESDDAPPSAPAAKLLDDRDEPLLDYDVAYDSQQRDRTRSASRQTKTFVQRMPPFARRVFGVVMSLVSGVFYGTNFDPPQYVVDRRFDPAYRTPDMSCKAQLTVSNTTTYDFIVHSPGYPASGNLIDYAFPHFCGIFLTSTFIMLLYCLIMRNNPVVYPQIIFPGAISGFMWAIAQCAWFIANQNLAFPVAFPIITIGPGLVG